MNQIDLFTTQDRNKIILYLCAILFLFLCTLGFYFFFRTNSEDRSILTDVSLHPSVPIENLLPILPENASERAVQDEKGLVYYSVSTPEELILYARDQGGEVFKRWTSVNQESDVRLEIVGIDDSVVYFIFTPEKNLTCSELWSNRYSYFGISLGTISYSGATGFLFERDNALLSQLQKICPNE